MAITAGMGRENNDRWQTAVESDLTTLYRKTVTLDESDSAIRRHLMWLMVASLVGSTASLLLSLVVFILVLVRT